MAELPSEVQRINCSTCARARGLSEDKLTSHVRNGTLEDLSELLLSADRFLTFAQEG
jgi:sulfur relay (sulfurtransferase) complex TusBCD TusD component (DsrE family)